MDLPNEAMLPSDTKRKFNSVVEARLTFKSGQLFWDERDYALLAEGEDLEGPNPVIKSHRRVQILSVEEIDSAGRPVFGVRDDMGNRIYVNEGLLYTAERLFGTSQKATRYGEWVGRMIMKRRADLAAGKRTMVTAKTVLPTVGGAAQTSSEAPSKKFKARKK